MQMRTRGGSDGFSASPSESIGKQNAQQRTLPDGVIENAQFGLSPSNETGEVRLQSEIARQATPISENQSSLVNNTRIMLAAN